MIGFSSLHLSLWPLSDLVEHYPLVIWDVFACVVVVAAYREDVLGGGVVVIPLEVCCPTNCFPLGLRGSRQSLWGGAEDILNFGGGVSLEGSSSSD